MKGVILAGGKGTRLNPITKIVNKHLIQVYDRPMIYFPLQTLIKAGITEIMIVSSEHHLDSFRELLGSGEELGIKLEFAVQKGGALGISDAIRSAKDFALGSKLAVILGDNIFEEDFHQEVLDFETGAKVFLKQVHDPERFGVAELDGEKVISLEEKPEKPKSNWIATGLYLYDTKVFDLIDTLEYSERGELEVTSLNKAYLDKGELSAAKTKGFWIDAGTFESLYKASTMVRDKVLSESTREHKSNILDSKATKLSPVSNATLKNA